MQILRLKDRISIEFETFTVKLKPLSYDERSKIESFQKVKSGDVEIDWGKTLFYTLKYSVADIIGLKDYKGEEIKPDRDGDYLSDEMISDLYNSSMRQDILQCINRLDSHPDMLIKGEIDIEAVKSVKVGN